MVLVRGAEVLILVGLIGGVAPSRRVSRLKNVLLKFVKSGFTRGVGTTVALPGVTIGGRTEDSRTVVTSGIKIVGTTVALPGLTLRGRTEDSRTVVTSGIKIVGVGVGLVSVARVEFEISELLDALWRGLRNIQRKGRENGG